MPRAILGVVVGYIAMLIFFFTLFTALYLILGGERVFEPGTFKISPLWIGLALIGSLCAGTLAGYLCFTISGSVRACQVLAVIVFLLAVVMCLPSIRADQTPRPRLGDLPTMEAMKQGQAPVWMHLLSAVFDSAGVSSGHAPETKFFFALIRNGNIK